MSDLVKSGWSVLLAALLAAAPAFAGPQSETAGRMSAAEIQRLNASLGRLWNGEGLDRPPQLLQGYRPYFPAPRILSGKEGTCMVTFTIGTDGHPQAFSADGADKMMCDHAIIALRYWRFSPAMKSGAPFEVTASLPFDYVLR